MIIKLDRTAFKRRLWYRAYQRQLEKKTDVSIKRLVFYGIKCYGRWYEKPTKKRFMDKLPRISTNTRSNDIDYSTGIFNHVSNKKRV